MVEIASQQLLLLATVIGVGCAVLSAWFADRKGRDVWGWAILGLLVGALALAIVIILPSRRQQPPSAR